MSVLFFRPCRAADHFTRKRATLFLGFGAFSNQLACQEQNMPQKWRVVREQPLRRLAPLSPGN